MQPTPGGPVRQGELRREKRVAEMLDTLPPEAQSAIREELAARGHGNGSTPGAVPAGAAAGASGDSASGAGLDDHYGSAER